MISHCYQASVHPYSVIEQDEQINPMVAMRIARKHSLSVTLYVSVIVPVID